MNVENIAIIDDAHNKRNRPKDWELVPIAQIISNIKGGVSVNGEDVSAGNGEPAVLKLSAISYGHFAPHENKVVHNHELNRLGPSVRKGTVLISRSNTSELVGACAHVDKDYPNLFLPDLIWEIEVNTDNDVRWLTYVLSSDIVRKRLVACASGTSESMKKISMASLRSLKVWRPTFEEQTVIVQILSKWDNAIEKIDRLVNLKENLFLCLLTKIFNGNNEQGSVRLVVSERLQPKRENAICKTWESSKLKLIWENSLKHWMSLGETDCVRWRQSPAIYA